MGRAMSRTKPQPKEVVIAVMGMTGVGKSTFIQRVTGNRDIKISSSLYPGIYTTPASLLLFVMANVNDFLSISHRRLLPGVSVRFHSIALWLFSIVILSLLCQDMPSSK